jgi:hypothetical protein
MAISNKLLAFRQSVPRGTGLSEVTPFGAPAPEYLGNSDGNAPFVRGLIAHNLIVDTIGYNLQIKHQNARLEIAGMPIEPSVTIIRHNVFSKENGAATGPFARPNVLVGHWPVRGDGSKDTYEIYGNFFYQNPTEALFQRRDHWGGSAHPRRRKTGLRFHWSPRESQDRHQTHAGLRPPLSLAGDHAPRSLSGLGENGRRIICAAFQRQLTPRIRVIPWAVLVGAPCPQLEVCLFPDAA